ncbi:unnamed protein product [Trichobilharzia regenti]|nr:unnamed protein product [Trichobilharzia regenti]
MCFSGPDQEIRDNLPLEYICVLILQVDFFFLTSFSYTNSMVTLPDQMPASFHSTYTPIAAAGTSAQIRHLARMLAVQLSVWAGEGGQYEVADRINQVETLLIPVDDADDDRGDSQGIRKRSFKSEPRASEQGSDMQKESMKSKKRRLVSNLILTIYIYI